jgi:hypothetical protein
MSRQIKPVDHQASTNDESLIPLHPFVMPIIGSIGEGKSTLLCNLLTKTAFYKQQFNRILFISHTADLDDKIQTILQDRQICISNQALQDAYDDEMEQLDEDYQRVILPRFRAIDNEDVFDFYNESILQNLYKHQKAIIKKFGKDLSDKCLIVIDDAITSGAYSRGHQTAFARFATSLRHVNCSLIHAGQLWKATPKIIRTQSTAGIFCGMLNDMELKDVYENFSCGMPYHRWCEIFSIIVSKPFTPDVFNLRNRVGYKMIKGFQEFCG